MIEVVLATPEHAAVLGANLREEDAAEVAAWGLSGIEGVELSIKDAFVSYVCLENGVPIGGWGARHDTMFSDYAELWCLTARGATKHPRLILQLSRWFVHQIQELYPTLGAMVDLRYEKAIRWTHWLGFEDKEVLTVNGLPFQIMQRTRH